MSSTSGAIRCWADRGHVARPAWGSRGRGSIPAGRATFGGGGSYSRASGLDEQAGRMQQLQGQAGAPDPRLCTNRGGTVMLCEAGRALWKPVRAFDRSGLLCVLGEPGPRAARGGGPSKLRQVSLLLKAFLEVAGDVTAASCTS
ncbi:hypothetical protein PLESTF_001259000 [Pleodorina starrii]|nr:hypothetical protein PLESTF_001259000 [Pleodorina starrii]